MGYEIKTLEDSLADYVFEINGAIALKNYTAQVDGDRITITSANNSALSILECDVSEVDIDGVIYDNAVDAQNALRSIIYNDLPIVVLTSDEKQKLILKLNSTHPDAKKIFSCDGSIFDFTDYLADLKRTIIDTTGLDEDKYYPIFIKLPSEENIKWQLNLQRSLNTSYGVPSHSQDAKGFSCYISWDVHGGNSIDRKINDFNYQFTDTHPIGSIQQSSETSTEIVYVRGGSKYLMELDPRLTPVLMPTGGKLKDVEYSVLDDIDRPIVDEININQILSTTTDIKTSDLLQGVSQNGKFTIVESNSELSIMIDSNNFKGNYFVVTNDNVWFMPSGSITWSDGIRNRRFARSNQVTKIIVHNNKAYIIN